MPRENKKDAIAAFHRAQILRAAETLFAQKGHALTTIEDISKQSGYSRRTIYAYYESKDDLLHHIVEKGLTALLQDVERALSPRTDFLTTCQAVWDAMVRYQNDYPYSLAQVNQAKSTRFDGENLSAAEKRILALGTDVNARLADLIEWGKAIGAVRQDVVPLLTVYVLWSSVTAFLTLVSTKGPFICRQFSLSQEELLHYGFVQIMHSILAENRIGGIENHGQ